MTRARILVLDESPSQALAFAALREHPQRELVRVRSVDAALDALAESPCALVLARAASAEAGGFALARRLRADGHTQPVAVLLVLPDPADSALVAKAWRSGAADIVCESMCAAALEHKIEMFVGFHEERQRLVELAASLDQALKVNELCAAMLAHDLRNPLTAVLTAAELLQRELPPAAVHSTALRLRSAGRRMQAMVERLLYVAQVRAGTLRMRFEALDLAALAADIADEFTDSDTARVRFELRGSAAVQADAGAIGQVLSNLIGNALRHGERDGEVQLRIDGEDADFLRVRVANPGSLPEDLRRAMGTAQPILHDGAGAGLGLYIVHQLVSLHCGSVDVDSDAAAGTAVTVTLPRRPAPAAPGAA